MKFTKFLASFYMLLAIALFSLSGWYIAEKFEDFILLLAILYIGVLYRIPEYLSSFYTKKINEERKQNEREKEDITDWNRP